MRNRRCQTGGSGRAPDCGSGRGAGATSATREPRSACPRAGWGASLGRGGVHAGCVMFEVGSSRRSGSGGHILERGPLWRCRCCGRPRPQARRRGGAVARGGAHTSASVCSVRHAFPSCARNSHRAANCWQLERSVAVIAGRAVDVSRRPCGYGERLWSKSLFGVGTAEASREEPWAGDHVRHGI